MVLRPLIPSLRTDASTLTLFTDHFAVQVSGIVAGVAYGAIAVKTGKLGESVAAHATTNTLVAIQVLLFDQWQLW
jgi:membrane protease YdiL (CAAX protease family)